MGTTFYPNWIDYVRSNSQKEAYEEEGYTLLPAL